MPCQMPLLTCAIGLSFQEIGDHGADIVEAKIYFQLIRSGSKNPPADSELAPAKLNHQPPPAQPGTISSRAHSTTRTADLENEANLPN